MICKPFWCCSKTCGAGGAGREDGAGGEGWAGGEGGMGGQGGRGGQAGRAGRMGGAGGRDGWGGRAGRAGKRAERGGRAGRAGRTGWTGRAGGRGRRQVLHDCAKASWLSGDGDHAVCTMCLQRGLLVPWWLLGPSFGHGVLQLCMSKATCRRGYKCIDGDHGYTQGLCMSTSRGERDGNIRHSNLRLWTGAGGSWE